LLRHFNHLLIVKPESHSHIQSHLSIH